MIIHKLSEFTNPDILAPDYVIKRINILYKILKIDENDTISDSKPKKYKKKTELNQHIFKLKKPEGKPQSEEVLLNNNLRVFLNKISKNNYNVQKDNIIHILDIIHNKGNMEETLLLYLDICSINRSLIEIYVELWTDILDKYDTNNQYKLLLINKYSKLLDNIQYVDPDKDYDNHCKINKENDKRRNLIIFVNKLIYKNSIDVNQLIILTHSLMSRIQENIKDKSMINIINEYIELFYLCVYENIEILKNTTDWACISKFIKEYIKVDKINNPGLSTRAIFKIRDIDDKL